MSASVLAQTAVRARLNFSGVVLSEWLKFFSLRSSYIVLGLFVLVTTGFNTVIGLVYRSQADADSLQDIHISTTVAQMTAMVGTLVIGILGVLCVTNEYSSGTVRSSFTAVPHRAPVIWGKAVVLAVVSAATSALAILISYGVAWLTFRDTAVDLSLVADENLRINLGIVAYVVTVTLLGLAIGTLIRSTAGAMATVVGLTFVLPIVADVIRNLIVGTAEGEFPLWRRAILYAIEALPAAAGSHVLTWDPTGDGGLTPTLGLGPWTGLAVMWAWTLAFAIPGLIRLRVKDA